MICYLIWICLNGFIIHLICLLKKFGNIFLFFKNFILIWESLFWLDTHKIKIYVRVSDLTSRKMDYWTDEAHKEWEYHQWFTFLLPSSSIMIGSIDIRLFSFSSWQNATKHKIIFSFLYSLFYIDIWSHNISNHYWRRLRLLLPFHLNADHYYPPQIN